MRGNGLIDRIFNTRIFPVLSAAAMGLMPYIGAYLRGRMVEYWLDSKNAKLVLCRNESDEKELERILFDGRLKTFEDIKNGLYNYQKGKIEGKLDPNRKTVAVFFPMCAYRANVGNIATRLRNKGYNVVMIVSTACGDRYEKAEDFVLYGGMGLINKMEFLDVIIAPTLDHNLSSNAKTVLFLHDVHDSPLGEASLFFRLSLAFDYISVPSKAVLERVKQQITRPQVKNSEKLLEKRKRSIGIITSGYIKLDRNMEYFEKHKSDEKIIIYAPTVTGLNFEGIVSLPGYGDKILGALLDGFPDYKVIFRPHPHTLHTSYVRNIVKKYEGRPGFIFDDNPSFYMDNYSRSALMVTDASGTAYTYAFTTLRPVVFFSHNEKLVWEKYVELKYFKDRIKVGYVVEDVESMVKRVRFLLESKDDFSDKIREYRDSSIYNVGSAEDYFVENFEYIVEGRKHPDWEYI